MTKENVISLYQHFARVAKGEYNLDMKFSRVNYQAEKGRGVTPEKKELIKTDALRHLQKMEEKHPWLKDLEKPEVKEVAKKAGVK